MPNIDYDLIRDSCNYGKYKILEYIGTKTHKSYVKIQFIDSLSICEVLLSSALSGNVRDPRFGFNPNKIFQSNTSGPFIMLKHLGVIDAHGRVLIKFLDTGTICDVQIRNALDGKVKDPALNGKRSNNYDISRIDDYDYHIRARLKSIYSKMISRCTNPNDPSFKMYGGIGVTVCDEWINSFDKFVDDVKYINGYNKFYNRPDLYNLDKDYKQIQIPKNQRVYSKDTCTFLHYNDNLNLKNIEYRNEHPSMQYFGVQVNKAGNFIASLYINNSYFYIGTFNNIIAAANAYNYWVLYFHNYELIPLLNDVPFMPPNEFIKYNVNTKQLYHLI